MKVDLVLFRDFLIGTIVENIWSLTQNSVNTIKFSFQDQDSCYEQNILIKNFIINNTVLTLASINVSLNDFFEIIAYINFNKKIIVFSYNEANNIALRIKF